MYKITMALWILLGLLMIDSIIELSFISSMVSYLHRRAGGDYQIEYQDGTFPLHGKPVHLLVDQGHTSNGAAGTAFVLVGIGGILTLALLSRHKNARVDRMPSYVSILHHIWLVSTVLSALLTISALIYTFFLTHQTDNQSISLALAASLPNRPYPNYVSYPLDNWAPETWFTAVLALPIAESGDRKSIKHWRSIMAAWRWNLVPMFIIGVAVMVVAFWDAWNRRNHMRAVRAVTADVSVKETSLAGVYEQS